ncbi:HD-GYP domain-containing protein [Desulfonatronum lacustre]|uniref:HD-GYP domain-containing protein n=1 Tax=Desulfonatronum lacustre TaxID=66849 RepID=UPI0006850198|nr:HD domain-containing phosphohydrolase [Desulfonatronum lacustre]
MRTFGVECADGQQGESVDCADPQLFRYAEDLAQMARVERFTTGELRLAMDQLATYAQELNVTVRELKDSKRELEESYLETMHMLATAAEFKDENTGNHILRIGRYSAFLADKYGLSDHDTHILLNAAPMHDVGKIGIPDQILNKPARLTAEEFAVITTHTRIGARILGGSKARILQEASTIALRHHENWDGSGYPDGLQGEAIPLSGRIVKLVDVFDALTTDRPYKNAYPVDAALEIIRKGTGTEFDPSLVELFLAHLPDILAIKTDMLRDETQTDRPYVPSQRDGG